jgi:hypothetical protein
MERTVEPLHRTSTLTVAGVFALCLLVAHEAPAIGRNPNGMLVTDAELLALDPNGPGWAQLDADAHCVAGSFCAGGEATAPLGDFRSGLDVCTLAKALVARRKLLANPNDTDGATLRDSVRSAIGDLTGDFNLSGIPDLLAAKRNLAAYILAADTIRLSTVDPPLHQNFKTMLAAALTALASGHFRDEIYTIRMGALEDPTNWGGMARATAVAAYLYLDDEVGAADVYSAQVR